MWSPINPFHRSTSQATTRSTTCSGILASVPGGALCTAGAAMLGSASSDYWLHAASHPNAAFSSIFTLKPCGAGTPPLFTCQGLFRQFISSVWPLGFCIPPDFQQLSSNNSVFSLKLHRLFDFCACTHPIWPPTISTIVHLGDFPSYGPVPSPIYWVFTNKFHFFHQS